MFQKKFGPKNWFFKNISNTIIFQKYFLNIMRSVENYFEILYYNFFLKCSKEISKF